jgi:hypothetical protein
MTKEERQRAGVMMVLSSVLAAKSLGALHASPAASTLPPAPQPTGPMPQRPAPLPPAIAGTGGQNQNLGAVPGGHAQNTPVGNATTWRSHKSHDVAQRSGAKYAYRQNWKMTMCRQTVRSQRCSNRPSSRSRSLPMAARIMCRQDLDRAQPQAIGHPAPPGSRRPTSVPPLSQRGVPPRHQIGKRHIPVRYGVRARSRILLDQGPAQRPTGANCAT